jgi:exodeoxyribonuclease V alpha subunit
MKIVVQIRFNTYYKQKFGIYKAFLYDNNGYCIESQYSLKGKTIYPLLEGRCYELEGNEEYDSKYGRTFNFKTAFEIFPVNKKQMSYLEISEIRRSYNRFFTSNITTSVIQKELRERIDEEDKVRQLLNYNINFLDAQKLVDNDEDILDKIKQDPYILLDIAKNFDFLKCDKIASKCNLNPNDSYRVRTGIRETLKDICNRTGNSFVVIDEFFIKLVNENLKYYLIPEDIKEIMSIYNQDKNNKLIDFNVFHFFYNTVFIPELEECIQNNEKYLFFETDYDNILNELTKSDKKFTVYQDKIYLTELYEAEELIANKIVALNKNKSDKNDKKELKQHIHMYESKNSITLNKKQNEAINQILEFKNGGVYILTGKAGTGKTTVVDAIVNINNSLNKHSLVALAAPTGKAVKVIKESLTTYAPVNTIHRMLGYNGEEFLYNEKAPLNESFIIVDETSMLDLEMASNLLRAIRDDSKVLFLGDPNQLPSIGPGKFLKDIIECLPDNIIELTEICRQKNGSGIIENSSNILNEDMIQTSQTKDNYVFWGNNVDFFTKRLFQSIDYLKNKCGLSNDEIEILTPMRIGPLGTYQLNKILQQKFNPQGYSLMDIEEYTDIKSFTPNKFKIGDKVINIKNNYQIYKYDRPINSVNIDSYIVYCTNIIMNENNVNRLDGKIKAIGVANGESGYITDIFSTEIPIFDSKGRFRGRKKADCITVEFDDGYICFVDSTDLRLGYAVSVHKSQGSGWKGVISIVGPGHQKMACNELIYVTNTRAREQNIYIGSEDIYKEGIHVHLNDRLTTLVKRFQQKNK